MPSNGTHRRFAVIGSNSFSGGHCVDMMLKQGHEVLGISRSPEKSDLFLPYKKRRAPGITFRQLDLNTQSTEVLDALDAFRPEIIINFAAQGEVGSSWKWPEQWFETNGAGIVKLTNGLKGKDYLKRYVQISTPEVYGTCEGSVSETTPYDPSTPYAASKAAGDLFILTLVKQYGFPAVTIRSTNVYGPHQQLYRIMPRSILNIKKGLKIKLHGGGRAFKAYMHIRDAVGGILLAAEKGRVGEVYHLSPDGDISIRELVAEICRLMGKDFRLATEDVAERPGQDARYSIDSSKARGAFGWSPTIPLEAGLKEMVDWIEGDWERLQNETTDYVHLK